MRAPELSDLLHRPLPELMAEAAARRDEAHGVRVTFSPKVFIPLTMLCRDRCGYCTFAKPPARLRDSGKSGPYLTVDEVLAIARAGRDAGCREALFTLGEAPEERYPVAAQWLADNGYTSTVDYLVAAAKAVLDETGLLPHANAGALSQEDLERLRAVSPSQGMMIESLSPRLHERGGAHYGAPDKTAERRLATLDAAGRAKVPFTTGILVGIGETREERLEALVAIADSHARHGHVQEVIVQNFLPKPGTGMHNDPPCPEEEMLWAVAAARLILPMDVHLQAPPNLAEIESGGLARLLAAGIDDWGGVSPVTPDHVNPERPWPGLDRLRAATEAEGKVLVPRLTVYPDYVNQPDEWLHPDVRFPVLCARDIDGLARPGGPVQAGHLIEGTSVDVSDVRGPEADVLGAWAAGGTVAPPIILPWGAPARAGGPVGEVLAGVGLGQEVGVDEIVTLLGARGPEVAAVAEVADDLRRQIVGDVVTFVRNRNINYTNVCTFKCKFCAFSKGPLSLNLRGDPYLLDVEEIQRRVVEAVDCGATEVCLQGGIHPSFDGDYYVGVAEAVKTVAPQIHIHGFTALEVFEGARRLQMPLADYLRRLKAAGLATLPGTAAEILDDEVRATLCPDKVNTEEWFEVHRVAHEVGLRSNVTIMFGHIEKSINQARHLVRARDAQKLTGGFTEVVPLPFVHMASPIFLQKKARPGPTFREALLIHAVSRIAMRGHIDNIQASWVKLGLDGARQCLQAGCNDLGGTLMNENISRAAGAEHGQGVEEEELLYITAPLGRPLEQRTTLYGRIQTEGKRLPGTHAPSHIHAPDPAAGPEPVTFTRRPQTTVR